MSLFLFILGIILVATGIVIFAIMSSNKSIAAIPAIVGLLFMLCACIYGQDIGQVIVLRNFGGSLAGESADAGFHMKTPWQDTITYDIRNNVLSFMGDEEEDQFEGGSANGSAVTINDKGGASATIDIQVNYSLDPSAAEELYANYGTQENFVKSICAVDIRAIPREVAGQFDTISILTARGDFTKAVQEALENRWKDYGLNIEQVAIQNVVYPQSIVDAYAKAQSAEIAKAEAENRQKTAEVEAQTKVIVAQGEADANATLARSLTNSVLMQHYIDALNKAETIYVVPEGSNPMVAVK